jgi:Asp-tRNA(Asn)/Glu-tRNA(Gln) amidotransferase A subunit family amidase
VPTPHATDTRTRLGVGVPAAAVDGWIGRASTEIRRCRPVTVDLRSAPLAGTAGALRGGDRAATEHAEATLSRVDAVDPELRAFLDEPRREDRVGAAAAGLEARHPDPGARPPLYGVPVGVKDVFHVSELPTRAGSSLPPGELAGPQADVVSALRDAGALVLGKTVTTEFAFMEPGPTRNPHDLGHTPGGSSSGSAAAVAAGLCPLALGTQTVGSTIRPAAFCGIVGFKPSFGRIGRGGLVLVSESADHVGLFAQDVEGIALAASVCCADWDGDRSAGRPVLGVPDGAYLDRATEAGRAGFERTVQGLADAGFEVRYEPVFEDVEGVIARHRTLVGAEMALAHHGWFERYGDRYAASTAGTIRDGRGTDTEALAAGRASQRALRERIGERLDEAGVDVWVSPAAPGPAPEGIEDTGDPVMNAPWTHAGVPAVSLPAGEADGLPLGLQVVGRFGADERLLGWAGRLAAALDGAATAGGDR